MRLIDADALLEREVYYDRCECLVLRYEIEKAPTINPEELRPKGRWVKDDWADFVKQCSCCGKVPNAVPGDGNKPCYSPYCPHCGAKMEVT